MRYVLASLIGLCLTGVASAQQGYIIIGPTGEHTIVQPMFPQPTQPIQPIQPIQPPLLGSPLVPIQPMQQQQLFPRYKLF